ncbi:MAG: hypothetical protein LUI60_03580, partial [Clostridia bacterium]|nr:hypothetical protein [Clostridia bacterium]
MENEKNHVSIFGSSTIHYALCQCDKGRKFVIDKFVQDINPVSLVKSSPLLKPVDYEVLKDYDKTLPSFRSYNFALDINKSAFGVLADTGSEWLFLDFSCLRYNLYKYGQGIVTNSFGCDKLLKYLADDGFVSQNGSRLKITDFCDEELYSSLDDFMAEIFKIYPSDRIVVFEELPVSLAVGINGEVTGFDPVKEFAIVIKGYEYVVNKYKNIHVVKFPVNTIGDINHRYGKGRLSYTREYYDYAYAAV